MQDQIILNSPTQFSANRVDKYAGIIRGMSVISEGEARGHDIFVDADSLKTCLAAANAQPAGVPSKAEHGTGVFETIGVVKNFAIDGQKLRGDLHLLKSHPRYDSIVEMAEKMPTACGLSISFSYAPEIKDGATFIRIKKLFSVDLVSDPACNPTGMFSTPRKITPFERVQMAFRRQLEQDRARAEADREERRTCTNPSQLSEVQRVNLAFEKRLAEKRLTAHR
jgi:hypothetical protein